MFIFRVRENFENRRMWHQTAVSSVLVILQIVYPGFLNSFSGLFRMSGL